MTLKFHPYAERFPLLEGKDYEEFRADIAASDGPREPLKYRIAANGEKEGLDGRNRYRACAELELVCPEMLVEIADTDVEAYVDSMNVHRRHLTTEQRTAKRLERMERVAAARVEGKSIRTIAAEEGVSKATVEKDLEESTVHGGGTVEPASGKVTGKDGKTRPAKKPKPLCEHCQRRKDKGVELIENCEACKELRKPKPKPKKEEPVADESPWVDGWGIPITKNAAKAFEAQEKFDELLAALRKAKSLYKELADHPGGAYLTRPGISMNARDGWRHAGIETCILNVKDCKPTYTVCPYEFSDKHEHGKDCTLCHGLGWVRPLGNDEIPASLVKAAKEANGVQ